MASVPTESRSQESADVQQPKGKRRRKVEAADTYLGVASKLLTIIAALSTVSVWAYTTFYVGSIEVKPDRAVDLMTVKLYDERGLESVYHTDRMKVLPGQYSVVVETPDSLTSRYNINVKFNGVTVVPYVVRSATPQEVQQSQEAAQSAEKNRRWWQFWKRN